ncbi:MAG: hypothetical protein AB1402_00400 [Bacillota bacterium]
MLAGKEVVLLAPVLLGLAFLILGILQMRFPARIIESRRGHRGRDRVFSRPERLGCLNLTVSFLMLGTGLALIWWGLTGGTPAPV